MSEKYKKNIIFTSLEEIKDVSPISFSLVFDCYCPWRIDNHCIVTEKPKCKKKKKKKFLFLEFVPYFVPDGINLLFKTSDVLY